MVNEAAGDINFYMQKATEFDCTILNADVEEDQVVAQAELKQILTNLGK